MSFLSYNDWPWQENTEVGHIGKDVSKGSGSNQIIEDIGTLSEGGGPVGGLCRR